MTNIAEYLGRKGIDFKTVTRPTGIWYQMDCPSCDDRSKKFAVHAEKGSFKCYHENKCGITGSFFDLQRLLGDEPKSLTKPEFTPRAKTYRKPEVKPQKVTDKVTQWLHARKITDDAIQQFHLAQKDNTTLMIPYYKNAEVVNVKYRDIETKKMWCEKNAEPVLFNQDESTGKSQLVICEGELDAIALAQYGVNAVSVPSGVNDLRWIENEWKWLEQFAKIYLIMDTDQAGQTAVKEIVTRLGKWRCYNVVLPEKDANECLIKGVPAETIIACIENATEFHLDNLKSAGAFIDEVIKLQSDDSSLYGIHTPFTGLDDLLKGWRAEELTLLSGTNGSGKSTLINQFVLDLANKKCRSCIASLEMPAVRYLRWAVMQGSKYQLFDEDETRRVLEWLDEYLYIVDTAEEMTPEAILDTFEFAARKYGVKFFFLDSLMRISFPYRDEYTEQKKFMSKLLSFVKEHRVHLFVVAHPRKAISDSHVPDKADVAGTANLTNLAHNVVVLWRVPEQKKQQAREEGKTPADALLMVKKNREWGLEGSVPLKFEPDTKLFRELRRN